MSSDILDPIDSVVSSWAPEGMCTLEVLFWFKIGPAFFLEAISSA